MKKITFLFASILLVSAHIQAQSKLQAKVISVINVICGGDSTGRATVSPNGGDSPYTYLWMPGGNTTATDTDMASGTYTVLITDIVHDSLDVMVVITQPTPLSINITSQNNVSCPGGGNGNATVAASGGTLPYTYSWSDGNTTAADSDMMAGNYTVTVTDNNKCTANKVISIGVNSTLSATISSTNVSCFGMLNGQAIAAALGGMSPYQYLWQPIGYTIPTASGLSAGTYTSQITDALGCITFNTVTLTQPAPLAVSAAVTDSMVNALVSGGTAPYTYQWLPGGNTTASVSGLSAGTYTLIVNDANLCTYTAVVMIPYNEIDFDIWPPSQKCGNPSFVTFAIRVYSYPPEILNNCIVDMFDSGSEFAGDNLSNGGIIVTLGRNFQPDTGNDYNIFNSVQLTDSVFQITLGDTSYTSPYGTVLYSGYQDTLFLVSLRIQNSCNSGTLGFATNSYGGDFAYYTLDTTLNETYHDTLGFDTVPYNCNWYWCTGSDGLLDSVCWNTCIDTVWIVDTYTLNVDTALDIYTWSVYGPSYSAPLYGCQATVFPIYTSLPNWGISAGTNAESIPPNSSLLTITGYGFGSTRGTITVPDANSGGTNIITLDNVDIKSWSENQIVVKMPSYVLVDTSLNVPLIPGSGPVTVNACTGSSFQNLIINYSITNSVVLDSEKIRYNIVMVDTARNNTESLLFRCDTSISNNPEAYACVRYAIKTWNCYTGINWKLGADTILDTTLLDGISDIYLSNSNFLTPFTLMQTDPHPDPFCADAHDSMDFIYDADIKIRRNLPGGYTWSYDTTGTETSPDSDYFYDMILHEMGHAHLLNHVDDSTSLMYYFFRHGRRVNILSGTWVGPQTLYAGFDVVSTDSAFIDGCKDGTLKNIPRSCRDATLDISPVSENENNLTLYPNPSSGNITVAYQLSVNSYVQFKITDCIGRVVVVLPQKNESPGTYHEQIQVNTLAQGVYLFIANINGEIQTIKFIKI
jgi:hypothetical protein